MEPGGHEFRGFVGVGLVSRGHPCHAALIISCLEKKMDADGGRFVLPHVRDFSNVLF